MNRAALVAIVLTLSGLFSYLNYRYVQLPTTIGVMLVALGLDAADRREKARSKAGPLRLFRCFISACSCGCFRSGGGLERSTFLAIGERLQLAIGVGVVVDEHLAVGCTCDRVIRFPE